MTHTKEKPYRCDWSSCGAAFPRKDNLINHKRTHTGVRPFKCDWPNCNATFIQKQQLTAHKRVHTREKPFKCNWPNCTSAFARGNQLVNHTRTHTRERPFKCSWLGCDVSFANYSNMKEHMRLHSDERRFKCPLQKCNMAFKSNKGLKSHLVTHAGKMTFRCPFPYCGHAFVRRGAMRKHYQSIHTKEGAQKQKKDERRLERFFESEEIKVEREVQINFRCANSGSTKTFCRIDFVYDRGDVVFAIECDENQHCYEEISCETNRMTEAYASMVTAGSIGTRSFVWLRYNPHAFTIDGKTKKTTKKDREITLANLLKTFEPTQPMEIVYMFYSVVSEEEARNGVIPEILNDPEYPITLKDCVTRVIV